MNSKMWSEGQESFLGEISSLEPSGLQVKEIQDEFQNVATRVKKAFLLKSLA